MVLLPCDVASPRVDPRWLSWVLGESASPSSSELHGELSPSRLQPLRYLFHDACVSEIHQVSLVQHLKHDQYIL